MESSIQNGPINNSIFIFKFENDVQSGVPKDIMIEIFRRLTSFKEIEPFRLVNKQWNIFIQSYPPSHLLRPILHLVISLNQVIEPLFDEQKRALTILANRINSSCRLDLKFEEVKAFENALSQILPRDIQLARSLENDFGIYQGPLHVLSKVSQKLYLFPPVFNDILVMAKAKQTSNITKLLKNLKLQQQDKKILGMLSLFIQRQQPFFIDSCLSCLSIDSQPRGRIKKLCSLQKFEEAKDLIQYVRNPEEKDLAIAEIIQALITNEEFNDAYETTFLLEDPLYQEWAFNQICFYVTSTQKLNITQKLSLLNLIEPLTTNITFKELIKAKIDVLIDERVAIESE